MCTPEAGRPSRRGRLPRAGLRLARTSRAPVKGPPLFVHPGGRAAKSTRQAAPRRTSVGANKSRPCKGSPAFCAPRRPGGQSQQACLMTRRGPGIRADNSTRRFSFYPTARRLDKLAVGVGFIFYRFRTMEQKTYCRGRREFIRDSRPARVKGRNVPEKSWGGDSPPAD